MKERKRRGREESPLFAAPRRRFYQRRRIPLREMQPVAADFQPTLEQVQLRAFSRAVRAFDHNQSTRIGAARNRPARLRKSRFCRLAASRLLNHVLSLHEPLSRGGDISGLRDRKSTRLNSSHVKISYAVFCLKKKKKTTQKNKDATTTAN